ncbi:MAG TPA: hypoxanthine phosphoribosyltransferase [Armatimonadetes bacterium]|nr:hypoxanthine phosphoribosyltransferase [Armatimonadota bacterium]
MPDDAGHCDSPCNDIALVLLSEQQIEEALCRLAERLTEDLQDDCPVLIGVLTGSFIFIADLVRRLDFPLQVEFVAARSYRDGTTAGELQIACDLTCEIAGRHIVIVDDIADSGETLSKLVRILQDRGAASVRTCCLLDKPDRRTCNFEADYVGATIPDQFVVGYGLDFAGKHRNLRFVGVLRPELYHTEP